MTVYNVNLGIGWASSGVEYAQIYREQVLKKVGIRSKFIFSDLILANNIEDLTKNIGFDDDEIIWFYNFFTDVKIAPSDYPLAKLEKELHLKKRATSKSASGNQITYDLADEKMQIVVRLHDAKKQTIDQVTYLYNNQLIKRDFYSYTKYAREYYAGTASNNYVTFREFYNEDGSIAYIQHLDGKKETFEFPNHEIYYSKNDLYLEMIKRLHLTKDDYVILDREDEHDDVINGQLFFEHHNPAKLIVVVHADHYDSHFINKNEILWNNFYEYQFTHTDEVASFIVSTPKQKELLDQQFKKYYNVHPRVDCIPVGNLPKLMKPKAERKPFGLITASRLASEKHVDWLVKAVIAAKKKLPKLSLDIYGQGGESGTLQNIISDHQAGDYIRLMGQHDLTDIYEKYTAYVAASTSEGFGLSLLEAVGSGLAMIGFDVPYGNPTFIDNKENGYLLPYDEDWPEEKKIKALTDAIVRMFKHADLKKYSEHSYEIATPYLTDNVAKQWKTVLEELQND